MPNLTGRVLAESDGQEHAVRRLVELGLGYYLPDRLDAFYSLRSYNSILMPFGSSTKMFRVVGVNWTLAFGGQHPNAGGTYAFQQGIPEYEAKRYEGRVRKCGILLSVHCDNSDWTKHAKQILEETGAEDVSSTGESSADFAKSDKPMPRAGDTVINRTVVIKEVHEDDLPPRDRKIS